MANKLTYKYVRQKVEERGYKLVSTEYIKSSEKLEIECAKHGIFEMRYNDFQRPCGCRKCAYENKRNSIEHVRRVIEDRGYQLISKKYMNSKTKLDIKCSEHGIFKMEYYTIQKGHGCPSCGSQRLTFEHVKREVEKRNYRLLSKKYVNNHTKIEVECSEHGIFETTYNAFQRPCGCPICAGNKKLTLEHVRSYVEKQDYRLTSKEYTGANAKLKIECSVHGVWNMRWGDFQQGRRCPSCTEYGFSPDKPAVLYYLEVKHRGRLYYKIGITNRDVQKRYSNLDLKKITILKEWDYENGGECRDEEQRIINDFSEHVYKGAATVLGGARANTEIFTKNILQL